MKRLAIAAFAAIIGLSITVQDAEARRLGGGRTSGISRDSSIMKREAIPAKPVAPSQAGAPSAAGAAAAAKPGMSRWLGPLAGLAAGIGLAALFSHLGIGEGLGNMLMMFALVMGAVFLVRWLMRRNQSPQPAMAYNRTGYADAAMAPARFDAAAVPTTSAGAVATTATSTTSATSAHAPADFDVDGFLRQAKLNFVRLQAANDRGDMDDIRQFTSPEMFAEVQLDYQDRDRKSQQTDVLELNAELLDVSTEATNQLASVRFSGQLREQANGPIEAFSEVWHLSKPTDGSRGWVVAGIQQA